MMALSRETPRRERRTGMTILLTEEVPYTTRYVTELLNVDEADLISYVHSLSLNPRQDEQTGGLIFGEEELELLRKMHETRLRGADILSPVSPPTQPTAAVMGRSLSKSLPSAAKGRDPAMPPAADPADK